MTAEKIPALITPQARALAVMFPHASKAARDFDETMRRLAKTASASFDRMQRYVDTIDRLRAEARRHHELHHPVPLAVNGHDYRRRRRARARR